MFASVCLNPCVDRTVWVPALMPGGLNIVDHARSDVAGKGINVAKVLRHLDADVRCMGFDYPQSGRPVAECLQAQGIPFYGVDGPGTLRVNLKLMDLTDGRMTEVNERGSLMGLQAADAVMHRLDELLTGTDLLILSGSVPPGLPADIYAQMICRASEKGVRTMLDASGQMLAQGLKARPWMIKPNAEELSGLFDETVDDPAYAIALCRRLLPQVTGGICLSMGADGAWLIRKDGTWHCPGVKIDVKSRQGAGDSMVAGLCLAESMHLPPEDQLRYACAASHASLILQGSRLCEAQDFYAFLNQMNVTEWK